MIEPSSGEERAGLRPDFCTTHWSVVLKAKEGQGTTADAALETLCRTYWYPLYVFIRRRGRSPADAEDLTQAFFSRLLEHQRLRNVHPDKGRFRSFLLASLKNFLANEHERQTALKRGGGCRFESFDAMTPEERYAREPTEGWTPDALFDLRWALTVLEAALEDLAAEYRQAGKEELFEHLRPFLVPGKAPTSQAALAAKLGKNEEAAAMDIHRLRKRYRARLLAHIAQTVRSEQELDAEVEDLMAIVSRSPGSGALRPAGT